MVTFPHRILESYHKWVTDYNLNEKYFVTQQTGIIQYRGDTMDAKARLQSLMDERGRTIYRLENESDVAWTTIRNMFARNTEPSIATLEALCKGMGITLVQFFDEDNSMGLLPEHAQLLQQWGRLRENDKRLIQELIDSLNEKTESERKNLSFHLTQSLSL